MVELVELANVCCGKNNLFGDFYWDAGCVSHVLIICIHDSVNMRTYLLQQLCIVGVHHQPEARAL